MNNTHGMDKIQSKERVKITCVERKYKVEKPTLSFVITAKTELDEDSTSRLLQEDMELKTFLANYEIVDIVSPPLSDIIEEHIVPIKPVISTIAKTKDVIVEDIENIKAEDIENIKPEDIENIMPIKKRSHKKKYVQFDMSHTDERRALFGDLDLPEEFTTKNYCEAFEKIGIDITNSAMPYDDLYYLEKLGKVKKLGKKVYGVMAWKKIKKDVHNNIGKNKKDVVKSETPIFI